MSRLVFISYISEIPWIARLADALREQGVSTELWTVGPHEARLAESLRAFDTIVDLRGDFRRRPARAASRAADADALAAANNLEQSLGFGPFLHREAGVDRVLTGRNHIELPPMRMSHHWSWPDVCRYSTSVAASVRARLREAQPRAVVGEASMFSSRLVARIVRAEGVPYLSPMTLPYLPGRIHFTDGLEGQWDSCVEIFEQLRGRPIPVESEAVAQATLDQIRSGRTMPVRRERIADYLGGPLERLRPARAANLVTAWREAQRPESLASPHSSYPELISPKARLVRKARRRRLTTIFDQQSAHVLPAGPFVAYFIHAQPEVTVEGWAHEFQDQVATIRNIAAVLPAGMYLAVKEHRVQAGLRDPSFYQELLSLPGIVLLNATIPTHELLTKAELVVSLTGTVTMEAMCLGTPSALLGSVYYEHFTGIRRPRSYREMQDLIVGRDALQPASDEDCLRALAARHLASTEGGWMSGGRSEADPHVTAAALLAQSAG